MEQGKISKVLIWSLVIILVLGGVIYGLLKLNVINPNNAVKESVKEDKIELDEVKVGLTSLNTKTYPRCSLESSDIAFNNDLFEPLATFNQENILVPVIASKWDNPDDLTWRFYISPKAKFSNSDPITAEDVKFTFDYMRSNKDLPLSTSLPDVEAKVGNDNTVLFTTKNPDPLLLNRLAWTLLILSKKDVEANGLSNKNIGSGPYILSEVTDQSVKLITNENYWREKPKIKNVTYMVVKQEDKIASLINGSVDLITYLSTDQSEPKLVEASKQGKVDLKKVASVGIIYMDLDSLRDKTPSIDLPVNPLKDKRVREAIALGLDIDDFVKNIPDTIPSNQLVSQGMFGYNPKISRTKRDVAKAKALLKEAGYENGFALTIDFPDTPTAKELYSRLAANLSDIDIKVTLNGLDQEKFFEAIVAKQTSAYFLGYSPDTKDASEVLEGLIHTPSEVYGQYNLGYSNTALDKEIEDASKTLNQQVRQQKVQAAMKTAMDDYAKIPLFQYAFNYALSSKIDWKPRLDGMFRMYEMAGKSE